MAYLACNMFRNLFIRINHFASENWENLNKNFTGTSTANNSPSTKSQTTQPITQPSISSSKSWKYFNKYMIDS